MESDDFERRGRGKYRPARDSHLLKVVGDYLTVRSKFLDIKENDKIVNKINSTDTGF
jgi:hypothetical protein